MLPRKSVLTAFLNGRHRRESRSQFAFALEQSHVLRRVFATRQTVRHILLKDKGRQRGHAAVSMYAVSSRS